MRLLRPLILVLVGAILTGVVVLIVVEIADYDGRTAAEVAKDERREHLAQLHRCPDEQIGDSEEEHDPGTRGETVPPGPTSAIICSSVPRDYERGEEEVFLAETVVRDRADLTRLTRALNSLYPVVPLGPGTYSCPTQTIFYKLIGLRYEDGPEAQITVTPALCGGSAALNLEDEEEFVASTRFLRLLDHLEGKKS